MPDEHNSELLGTRTSQIMRLTKNTFLSIICITLCVTLVLYTSYEDKDGYDSTRDYEYQDAEEDSQRMEEIRGVEEEEGREATTKRTLPETPRKLNVLMMLTDDMRPQLGCYSGEDFPLPTKQEKMYTPHLDRLASKSLLLKRAYVQYSLCGPSRASMMTSRRPDTTRIYGNNLYWRVVGGNFTTLPQYFKQHGYHAIGLGKVFHQFKSSNNQDPISWSEPYYHPPYADAQFYHSDAAGYKAVSLADRERVMPLTDEHSVQHFVQRLEEIAPEAKSGDKPFFAALGFCKPHINLVCGEEHFKHYELEKDEKYLPVRDWQTPIVSPYCNMANVTVKEDGSKYITDSGLRHLRQAYAACITFVDDMVGQLLDKVESLGLSDSTVIVFVADHGHHNGENAHWGKTTNYELGTHVPMMVRIPGKTDQGIVTRSLVEAVDLYPTIVEAAGLGKVPECKPGSSTTPVCTEGMSMLPLVENPDHPIKQAVFHQTGMGPFAAYAIRTDKHRYVAYAEIKKVEEEDGTDTFTNEWDHGEYWTELYDLSEDPEERYNRTDAPRYEAVKGRLDKKLKAFFTGATNVPRPEKKKRGPNA